MVDFTSALYLGLRHPTSSLRSWHQFTTGVPAVLRSPPPEAEIAHALATLQGCERATLSPSTLHFFWDWFGLLSPMKNVVFLDGGVYAIARWGAERAAARGVRILPFPHYDAFALKELLARERLNGRKPIVVADGFCPSCGKAAPVKNFLREVRNNGGYLVLDDTQALGILGHSRSEQVPYGRGGGGSLRWHELDDSHVLVVSSLAKGFGVPMAAMAGSHAAIRWFEDHSETRMHCSPVSIACLRAAEHALAVNVRHGEALRSRLIELVHVFRRALTRIGWRATGGLFPVQTLVPNGARSAVALYEYLRRHGIQTVLRNGHNEVARISLLLTARHSGRDINAVVEALNQRADSNLQAMEATYGTGL